MTALSLTRRLALLCCSVAIFSACSIPVKTRLLKPLSKPVTTVDLVIYYGELPSARTVTPAMRAAYSGVFKEAILSRIPAILRKNGLAVSSVTMLEGAGQSQPVPEKINRTLVATHRLSIAPKRYVYDGTIQYVEFEAALYERPDNLPSWTGTVQLGLTLSQPKIRTELLSRDLLQALASDGVVSLPASGPLDLSGEPIRTHLVWESDR